MGVSLGMMVKKAVAGGVVNSYDTNQDWTIGNFELLNAIDDWAAGNLGNFELLDLIDMWAFGSYCWDTATNGHKAGLHNGSGACVP